MESKFKSMLAQLNPINTGTKASNDTAPTLTVLGIPNKFQLNRLATDLMGLKVEDRVKIFEFNKDENFNQRYFIAKADKNDTSAAKVAASNSQVKATSGIDMAFNYSGVWSCLVQGEVGSTELGYDAMVEKGCVVKGVTTGNKVRYRAAVSIKLDVQEVGPASIDGVDYGMVYVLTNYRSSEKSIDDLNDEEAVTNEPVQEAVEVDPFAGDNE